ncbi:hypothetical protein YT1_3083 [Rhodococcus ruber]|nr:hypothetical protein YT1_3083 [Rhodococcus ruber]
MRADKAVRLGTRLAVDREVNNHPIGYLAGVQLSTARAAHVLALWDAETKDAGAAASKISLDRIRSSWRKADVEKVARSAAYSADLVTMAVTAALLASMRTADCTDVALTLSGSLTQSIAFVKSATRRQRHADRILAAAYALAALGSPGLDLAEGAPWEKGATGWRFRAAPWLLAILDSKDSATARRLLDAALDLKLDFVPIGTSPFDFLDETEHAALDNEIVRARTLAEAHRLSMYSETPMWFDGGDNGQVLLTMGGGHGYAWVGRKSRGVLVAFDLEHFTGYGLDEPGVRAAIAMAIGWFVDVSVRILKAPAGTNQFTRKGTGSASGYRYLPTPTFRDHVNEVPKGAHRPPQPHVVRAQVMRLPPGKMPSLEALSRAPRHLRKHMGSQDTYGRQHWKGGATSADLGNRLSKYSQLADVIRELRDANCTAV